MTKRIVLRTEEGAKLYRQVQELIRTAEIDEPLIVDLLNAHYKSIPFWLHSKKVKEAMVYAFFVGMAYQRRLQRGGYRCLKAGMYGGRLLPMGLKYTTPKNMGYVICAV